MRVRLLSAAALFAFFSSPAWSINLAEAYRLALLNDAYIRESRATAEAGREKLPQARAQFLPNIGITSTLGKNSLETTSMLGGDSRSDTRDYGNSNATLQLRVPIYRKQLFAQYEQAKAQVAQANAVLERDEQRLVMRVTEAYFNVLLANEQVKLLEIQRRAYETQVDAASKGFQAGTGTRTDVDEAQSRLDLTIAQQLEARQNADVMRRKLETLVNQPVTAIAAVDVRKLQLKAPTPAGLEEWTQLADLASPEVQAARAQVDVSRAEIERARAAHYPTLDAYAQLSRTLNDSPTSVDTRYVQRSVGVQLSVPLFAGGYVNSQVREALARLEAAQSQLDEVRRDLGVRVHQEYRGVTEGLAKIQALEQAVKSTEQLVTSSRRSFEAGVRTRLDILNAEQQAGQARRDLAQARFQYMFSRIRLKALAGDVKVENIAEINGWLEY